MHLDVVELRAFYYRTMLGRSAQKALQEAVRSFWPSTRGMTVVGFGFAAPLLRPFLADARRVIGLMPAQQGVMPWPAGQPNLGALVEETAWPIAAGSVDRLIVAHGLETGERPGALLDEIWRVLAPAGQVIFIVPNRSGLWARRDVTPFGYGRPYSGRQMETLLRKHRFEPQRRSAALFGPPSHAAFWLRTAPLWERLGRRLDHRMLAGALLVEATKQIYARPDSGSRVSVLGPLHVLDGFSRPRPEAAAGFCSTTVFAPQIVRQPCGGYSFTPSEKGAPKGTSAYCHSHNPLLSTARLQGALPPPRHFLGAAPPLQGIWRRNDNSEE